MERVQLRRKRKHRRGEFIYRSSEQMARERAQRKRAQAEQRRERAIASMRPLLELPLQETFLIVNDRHIAFNLVTAAGTTSLFYDARKAREVASRLLQAAQLMEQRT